MFLFPGMSIRISFAQAVLSSKTIIWNGPMGVFEMASFEKGNLSSTHPPPPPLCLLLVV